MSRWVIATRRQRTPEARRAAAKRTEDAFKKHFDGSSRVRGINRGGEARDYFAVVFDADPSETRLKKRFLPREDAMLEPEILHGASATPRIPRVFGDGQPLAHARVTLLGGSHASHEGGAHAYGLHGPHMMGAARASASAALIEPSSGYWSMRVPDVGAVEEVHLDPLPPGPYGWWHAVMCRGAREHESERSPAAGAGRGAGPGATDPWAASRCGVRGGAGSGVGTGIGAMAGAGPGAGARAGAGAAAGPGIGAGDETIAREPIAVGVIDTGCGPHAALWHVVDHGAYVHGVYSADGRDGAQHGTHVCGLIGARACPDEPAGYLGLAPEAAIHSIRVCAIGSVLANQVDIALALRRLMTVPVHLVTIGLSAAESSAILADAIREAMEAGILCICPAGNTASRVRYPAALDDTAAVTAVGLTGWGPPHARVHDFEPPASERLRFGALDDDDLGADRGAAHADGTDGAGTAGAGADAAGADAAGAGTAGAGPAGAGPAGAHAAGADAAGAAGGAAAPLYIASFSCVAPTPVTCAGPGVGIISCVPGEDGTAYAEMSGTSMAAALVTGALASILAGKENYLTLPRTLERADFAHALLGLHCRSLGIDRRFQGRGIPCVTA